MRKAIFVKYYTIVLIPLLTFVAFLINLVKYTDADRQQYISHFSRPFSNGRIEIGFQYYMEIFHLLNISPIISTVFTSLIIYTLLYKIWFKMVKIHWIESILIINIVIIGIFNYYLGTSIRMGLALSLAIYSFYKIQDGSKYYYLVLLFSPLIHYGISLFVILFLYMKIFHLNSWKLNRNLIFIITIILIILLPYILNQINFNDYYTMYLNGFGKTSRIFSFGMLLYIFSLILLFSFSRYKSFNTQLISYGIPFLIVSIVSGIVVIQKMLVPLLFIALIEISNLMYPRIRKYVKFDIRFMTLVVFNILSILYALKMYNYI